MTFEPSFTRYRYVDSRAFRKGVRKYASLRKQIAAKVNIIAPHEIAYGKK